MGRLFLDRERRKVRVYPRQLAWTAKPLTLVLSPSPRGEARRCAFDLAPISAVRTWWR